MEKCHISGHFKPLFRLYVLRYSTYKTLNNKNICRFQLRTELYQHYDEI